MLLSSIASADGVSSYYFAYATYHYYNNDKSVRLIVVAL